MNAVASPAGRKVRLSHQVLTLDDGHRVGVSVGIDDRRRAQNWEDALLEGDALVRRLRIGAKTVGADRGRHVERVEMELIRRARRSTRFGRVARPA